MHSGNFSIFANDPGLPSLSTFSAESLKTSLARHLDTAQLDADIADYSIDNLRYKPGQKMVLGLTAPGSNRPIAIRIYGPEGMQKRLSEARSHHPDHVFALPELNGLAWVFPGERKLDLQLVADDTRLADALRQHRELELKSVKLERFVPEHTYTARVEALTVDGTDVTDYLKIHYNHAGAGTAHVMKALERQLVDDEIDVPSQIQYLSEHKMLLQRALPRKAGARVSDDDVAKVLARIHGLQFSSEILSVREQSALVMHETGILLETSFPGWKKRIIPLWLKINQLLSQLPGMNVPIHGDVHLGNIFPLNNGRTGLIDFDAFSLGEAEHDLCGYFGFKLWLALREKQSTNAVLGEFQGFIDTYNRHAKQRVYPDRAYLFLAEKMLSERIRRGLARGKISGESELASFFDIADTCLVAAQGSSI